MVFIIIIAFGMIVLFEIPGLIQKRYWPELVAFSILLFLSFGLSLLIVFGVNPPYISSGIGQIIKKLLNMK